MAPWRAPGPDGIAAFWIKKFAQTMDIVRSEIALKEPLSWGGS